MEARESHRQDPAAQPAGEYRLRFFSFNMANASGFHHLGELQGPGGRGRFDAMFGQPLADDGAVDLVFATLVETRLALGDWLQEYLACPGPLDRAITQNACREGTRSSDAQLVYGWMESIAANYNGNLKSVLAWSSSRFELEESARLFGRLRETTVAGLAIPNPKKAFMGRTVREAAQGVRFIFTGAHFPISDIAAALEGDAPLHGAKVALAKTLKFILHKASQRDLLDEKTILFVQGDFNSRTVLQDGRAWDVLLELLRDDTMQAAIREELSVPRGRWYEVVGEDRAERLPVTYKFSDTVGQAFDRPEGGEASDQPSPTFTIGDVLEAVSPDHAACEGAGIYRSTLHGVQSKQLKSWGVHFKESEFRPFRFPACADRIAYWAPDSLAAHMSWSLPRGGYEINHLQAGSDHRPISLEAVLRIAPVDGSPPPEAGSSCPRVHPSLLAMVRVSNEHDDSD